MVDLSVKQFDVLKSMSVILIKNSDSWLICFALVKCKKKTVLISSTSINVDRKCCNEFAILI